MKLEAVEVSLSLPGGIASIGGTWKPADVERQAAWEMYVELITRISVADLPEEAGLLREALTSLHSLFESTREILRRHGPDVARPSEGLAVSFGYLAVAILNGAVRPLLSVWHPRLQSYESSRPTGMDPVEWERSWTQAPQLRDELGELRGLLRNYAGILGEVCGARLILNAVDFAPEGQSNS